MCQDFWIEDDRVKIQSDGSIDLRLIGTNDMVADLLTKSLARVKHERFCRMLGMETVDWGSVVRTSDCGGVLKLQSAVHDGRYDSSERRNWWC